MYESRKNDIDAMRVKFDAEVAERAASARATAEKYLEMLSELIDAIEDGPIADARVNDLDTTGTLNRAEEFEEWAEKERHRVRRALQDIS